MKKLIISVLILFVGCSMAKPNLKDDYIGLSEIGKKVQFIFDRCCYNQQFTKIDLKCTEILRENRKIQNLLDFDTLKKSDKLPELFNQKGKYIMNFDDYFKYIK